MQRLPFFTIARESPASPPDAGPRPYLLRAVVIDEPRWMPLLVLSLASFGSSAVFSAVSISTATILPVLRYQPAYGLLLVNPLMWLSARN